MDLRPGDTVFGSTSNEQYQVIGPIGRGGFGIVYEIRDTIGNKSALKTISTIYLDENDLRALVNEGRLATEVAGENIIRVLYFHDGTTYPQFPPYIIMEYADGGNLDHVLQRAAHQSTQFTSVELKSFFVQLARGMENISKKLVHRDLKPTNILIDRGNLKIADFGLSKFMGAATRNVSFKGVQDIRYMAPEAWRLEANTAAMDMYSMGIVFYQLATLRHPYTVTNSGDYDDWKKAHFTQTPADPHSINSHVDLRVSQLILKMMSKRPEDRYSSWPQVIERIMKPSVESHPKLDVGFLVRHVIEKQQQQEQLRIAAEESRRLFQEREAIVSHSFNELLEGARLAIDSFNEASDQVKLALSDESSRSFSVMVKGRAGSKKVTCNIAIPPEGPRFDERKILAWGIVESPQGLGFNVLLVLNSDDAVYGTWHTLHIKHNPLVHPKAQTEPFALKFAQLPQEIQRLSAMRVYQSKMGLFSAGQLLPLIKDIL